MRFLRERIRININQAVKVRDREVPNASIRNRILQRLRQMISQDQQNLLTIRRVALPVDIQEPTRAERVLNRIAAMPLIKVDSKFDAHRLSEVTQKPEPD